MTITDGAEEALDEPTASATINSLQLATDTRYALLVDKKAHLRAQFEALLDQTMTTKEEYGLTLAVDMITRGQKNAKKEKKSTGLLDLPDEIWLKIGKLVIDDFPALDSIKLMLAKGYSHIDIRQPPITRVAKALRNELLPYYYATRIEVRLGIVLVPHREFGPVSEWLHNIGATNRRALKGVVLEGGPMDMELYNGSPEYQYLWPKTAFKKRDELFKLERPMLIKFS